MKIPLLLSWFLLNSSFILHGQTPVKDTVRDIDGHAYLTVIIGDYEWMTENLNVTTYHNGTVIPLVAENHKWTELNTGAFCWYDNDESNAQSYGALYNWYAVETGMLCPDGWRVPSDMEWNYLEAYVDSVYVEDDLEWYKPALLRGYDAAKKLKALSGWRSGGNGTDNYGFCALPGGERRVSDGTYFQLGGGGFWWSSAEEEPSEAWFRSMAYSFDQSARNTHDKRFGFSVRCLRKTANLSPR